MNKILPLLLILIGVAGGSAAGFYLKPVEAPDAADADDQSQQKHEGANQSAEEHAEEGSHAEEADLSPAETTGRTFVKVGKQTIIPIVEGGETKALMLFELAVDVPVALSADVHDLEPRLRDAFLRELFKMSYTGAFTNNFTDDRVIKELRRNLTRAARRHLGEEVSEVLILDVMRQEM